jgi:hypothetical protein
MGLNWEQLLLVLPYVHIALAMEAGAPPTEETAELFHDELWFLRDHFVRPKLEGSVSYACVEALHLLLPSEDNGLFRSRGLSALFEVLVYDLRLAE